MTTIDVKGPGIISLSSITKEEDLKPRPGPKINAPLLRLNVIGAEDI